MYEAGNSNQMYICGVFYASFSPLILLFLQVSTAIMNQLESRVQEYFSSLSCVSKNFIAIENYLQEVYGDKWDTLSEEEKETIFDDFIIPRSIAEKYNDDTKNLPEVFPKLKVPCGEKIVVEESGRTWVDEHSGPFSWANRSQQDLRLFGVDDEDEKKPVRPPRRHRSSEEGKSPGNALGKPSGNPQTAADEIFQKFGIQFGQEEEEEEDEQEDSRGPLLPNSDSKTQSSYINTQMLPKSEIDHMTSQMDHVTFNEDFKSETYTMPEFASKLQLDTTDSSTVDSSKYDNKDFTGETYTLPELSSKFDLGTNLSSSPEAARYDTEPLNPSNETAHDLSVKSTDITFETDSQVVDVQPISIPYPEFLEADEQEKDLIPSETKTGFDFLDNW